MTSANPDLYAKSMAEFWDRIGISASILCALHCLLTPFLILLIPFVGNLLADAWIHVVIAAVIFPVAVWALWNGYKRHRLRRILIIGGFGLLLMSAGMVADIGATSHQGFTLQTWFMIAAGITLASAHFFNLRACQIKRRGAQPLARP